MVTLSQKIFHNINWILIEKITKATLTALMSIIVARYLGANGLGAISIALTIYSIFAVFGTLGLERILLKELEVKERDPKKLIGGAIILRGAGAFIAFTSMNIAILFIYPDNLQLQLMILMLSFTYFIALGDIFEVIYRRRLHSKYVTVVRVLGLFSSAICKISIVLLELDVIWFTIPVIIETTVVSVGFIYLFSHDKEFTIDSLEYTIIESQRIFKMVWPLLLSGLVGTLYFQMDKVIIYQYMDEASLGRYALLFQLVSIMLLLIHSINLSVIPSLNKLYFVSRKDFWNKYREITAFKFLLAVVLGLTLTLTGNFFIPLFVGDEFMYSPLLLVIFSLYLMFVGIGSLQVEYCILIGVIKPLFYLRLLTLTINLILNIVLIPVYGLEGAAIASVSSYFLNQFILPMLITEIRPVIFQNIVALNSVLHGKLYRDLYSRCVKLL